MFLVMFKMRETNKTSSRREISFIHSTKVLVVLYLDWASSSEAIMTLHPSCMNVTMIQQDTVMKALQCPSQALNLKDEQFQEEELRVDHSSQREEHSVAQRDEIWSSRDADKIELKVFGNTVMQERQGQALNAC